MGLRLHGLRMRCLHGVVLEATSVAVVRHAVWGTKWCMGSGGAGLQGGWRHGAAHTCSGPPDLWCCRTAVLPTCPGHHA
jgi:hypothetical protein